MGTLIDLFTVVDRFEGGGVTLLLTPSPSLSFWRNSLNPGLPVRVPKISCFSHNSHNTHLTTQCSRTGRDKERPLPDLMTSSDQGPPTYSTPVECKRLADDTQPPRPDPLSIGGYQVD